MRIDAAGVYSINISYYLGSFVIRNIQDPSFIYYATFYKLSKGKVLRLTLGYNQVSYIGDNDVINYINIL